ncbi:uncharacterized protein H6S33_003609 [Morchella sextelata]|uniref:uncharacterized protein n=1 Tax=Morchella sextelata TaxID=1174677 RepID=UPI001D045ED3|nr:uncharacterized protein H6S33_003609 [Morchella sextelata]KAH0606775.1 hypothetical protein H6S33_003609 [Morchella sextelata]
MPTAPPKCLRESLRRDMGRNLRQDEELESPRCPQMPTRVSSSEHGENPSQELEGPPDTCSAPRYPKESLRRDLRQKPKTTTTKSSKALSCPKYPRYPQFPQCPQAHKDLLILFMMASDPKVPNQNEEKSKIKRPRKSEDFLTEARPRDVQWGVCVLDLW